MVRGFAGSRLFAGARDGYARHPQLAPARDSVRDGSLAWLHFLMLISVPFGRYFRLAFSRE